MFLIIIYIDFERRKVIIDFTNFRLFLRYPDSMKLLPKIQHELPSQADLNSKQDEFRNHPVIRMHGGAIIRLLDEMIKNFHDPKYLFQDCCQAVRFHEPLHDLGFKGDQFKV